LTSNRAAKEGHVGILRREFNRYGWGSTLVSQQVDFLCDLINGGAFDLAHKFLQQHPGAAGNSYESSPIYVAARRGNLELVRSLVEKYGASPDYAVRRKWPYDIAAERGHIDIMRYLHTLPDGDSLSLSRAREATTSYFPAKRTLFYAVRGGHLDVVRMLVKERHHPLTSEEPTGPSLMTIAITKQRWSIVEYLQSKGLRLQHKRRVLEYAARKRDCALAEYIIDHHLQHILDPQRRWIRFHRALLIAASNRGNDVLRTEKMFMLLLERCGQQFDAITNPLVDKKFLMKAVQGNSVVILQKVWDLGCRDIHNRPRLLVFASSGRRDTTAVLRWLLEHGVNPCVTRVYSYPIDIITHAIQFNSPTAAIQLIEGVSNWLKSHPPSLQDQQEPIRHERELHISQLNQKVHERQVSPLQAAVEAGYTEVLEALLANGVDVTQYPR